MKKKKKMLFTLTTEDTTVRRSRQRFSTHWEARAARESHRFSLVGITREETCRHDRYPNRNLHNVGRGFSVPPPSPHSPSLATHLDCMWRAMQNCQTYFCGLPPMEAEMDGAKLGTSQWV